MSLAHFYIGEPIMKPVMQTVLYGDDAYGNGNCVDACLASLMELPLWMVPPFYQMWGRPDRHRRLDHWLLLFGLELEHALTEEEEPDLPLFYMVSGGSPRNPTTGHAVIYSAGVMVHDPHYSGAGILEVRSISYLKQFPGKEIHPCIPRSSVSLIQA